MSWNPTGWIDGRIRVAVDEAIQQLHTDIRADLQQLETNLVAQVAQLPGLVASQVGHVAVDVVQLGHEVAQAVIAAINPFGPR